MRDRVPLVDNVSEAEPEAAPGGWPAGDRGEHVGDSPWRVVLGQVSIGKLLGKSADFAPGEIDRVARALAALFPPK